MSDKPKNPAMYLAFKNAFEGIRREEPKEDYVINRVQKAPFVGKIPIEKIQAAVNSVRAKDED
jgi:hypothetical protein